jgi:hypothetical protein
MFRPLTELPSELGDYAAESIDPLEGDRGYVRPFIAGSLQGAGDVLSDMTSPMSLLSSATGLSAISRLGKGVRRVSEAIPDEIYSRLGPEFLPNTEAARNAFNRLRKSQLLEDAQKVKDVSYEGSRLTTGRIPVSGNVDVAEAMARIAKARGR